MPKKFLFIIADFILIVIIVLIMSKQIDNYKGLKQVYVAKTQINKGVKITADMVELRNVTLNRIATGSKDMVAYYEDVVQKPGDVVGEYAKYDLISGEIIVKEKLQKDMVATGDEYMYNIPKGYYAYPIALNDSSKKASLIKVNDYADVYVVTKDQGVIDEPALRHLRVYDLKSDKGQSITGDSKDENGQPILPSFAIFELNDYQLNKIASYTVLGATFDIALRQRPKTDYEIFSNSDIVYPSYSISPDTLIDAAAEQQLIDENKFKLDNQNFNESSANNSKKATNTTNGQSQNNSTNN